MRSTARARASPGRPPGPGPVAGSRGPLGKPLELFGNITFDDAVAAYREQARGLVEGGVDLFLLETMPSLDQARAAVTAVKTLRSELPIVVSLTFNEEGVRRLPRTSRRTWWTWRNGTRPSSASAPGPAADARHGTTHGRRRVAREALRRSRGRAPPSSTVVTSTSGTPRSHGLLRAPLHLRGVSFVGLLRNDAAPHPNLVRSVRMVQPAREVVTSAGPGAGREARAVPGGEEPRSRASSGQFVVSVELDPPKGPTRPHRGPRPRRTRSTPSTWPTDRGRPPLSASLCVLFRTSRIDTILTTPAATGTAGSSPTCRRVRARPHPAITGDRRSSATTRTRRPCTTWTRSASSGSWTTQPAATSPALIGPALGIHIGCGAEFASRTGTRSAGWRRRSRRAPST